MSELYLSRLRLEPRHHLVQRALADCHALHQHLMTGLPTAETGQARAQYGVLYRIDVDRGSGIPTLLVQTAVRPDWTRIGQSGLLRERAAEPKEIAAAYETIAPGQRLRFRLRANPTRRVNRSHAGSDRLAGKRVELRDEESQRTWLTEGKADQCGFRVLDLQVRPGDALGAKQGGWRREDEQRRKLTFGTVVFDGVLEVTDAERFRAALRQGIGSGKAYGFGLLSVAPAEG
jgi:CRISPR system Cascade subunit CasE